MASPRAPVSALTSTLQTLFHDLPGAQAAASALGTANGSGTGTGTDTDTDDPWERALLHNARHVSTPLALRLLRQMGVGGSSSNSSDAKPIRLFENTCGVGVVAPALRQVLPPEALRASRILCGDFSEKAVALARRRAVREGWAGEVVIERIDAQNTGLPDKSFTHVAVNIGFHVVPDSEAALNEAIRVLEPGGVLGFTTWHREAGWLGEVKEAFKSFPFDAPCNLALQTTAWGKWDDVNWVRKTLQEKGLQDVKVDVMAFLSPVASGAEFVSNYSMMIDWIMGSSWTEELRNAHPREEVQTLVKEYLDKKYGGGAWEVSWVGLVASGRVPS